VTSCRGIIELPALLADVLAGQVLKDQVLERLHHMCRFGFSVLPAGCKLLRHARSQLNLVCDRLFNAGYETVLQIWTGVLGHHNFARFPEVSENPVEFYMESHADCLRVLSIDSATWGAWHFGIDDWKRLYDALLWLQDMLMNLYVVFVV
jgi:hypothetical protein